MINDLINTIHVDKSNFEHISKTGIINGTLLGEITRIMLEYAKQQANGCNANIRQLTIPDVSNSMPNFGFVEWCGSNFIRMNNVWCHRYSDQRDVKNWKTSEELYNIYNNSIDC